MNVACIIHSLDGGGAERVMAGLCTRLSARGHQVTLITLDNGQRNRHEVDASVQRVPLDVMGEPQTLLDRGWMASKRIRKLRDAIRVAAPQVVLSFCDRTNVTVLLATRNLAIPVVVSERSDPDQQSMGRVWELLRRWAYPRATAIAALTETSARSLRAFGRPVKVIPSAIELPPDQSCFGADREQAIANQRVLSVGRLEHEKGHDRLIEAFSNLVTTHPAETDRWSLRILGEGSQRQSLQAQIDRSRLDARIELAGWVSPTWDELSAATMFALTSRYEGFPSALLEAMAAGVPSLSVDCESGPRAILSQPDLGLLVPNSQKGIEAGLLEMITNQERRERLGRAGAVVRERFSWERMVAAYESLLLSQTDQ